MACLTKTAFLANLDKLRSARLAGGANTEPAFYDSEFLRWLDEAANSARWLPFAAFKQVATRVLQGPLDFASLGRYVAGGTLPAEVTAAQLGHRFHGLMAAFSPSGCFDDPARTVSGADELIRSSEGDLFRCKPFVESIQRFVAEASADQLRPLDMLDAGCGPHLFWSVLALSMSESLRVCALEREPALATQARQFAQALGIEQRVCVLVGDATSPAIGSAIRAAFAGDAVPFEPALVVSETHCVLMFEEAGDQVLRNLHRQFPTAALVPEGVELVGGFVDASQVHSVLAATPEFSFDRLTGVANVLLELPAMASLGQFMARDDDALLRLDVQGRRRVGPLRASPSAQEPLALTPVFGTRLLFPFGVSPLEPGHSLGITEWLWAMRPAYGAGDAPCCLGSIFLQAPGLVVCMEPYQQFCLDYFMGARIKPIYLSISSTPDTIHKGKIMRSNDINESETGPSFTVTTSSHFLPWMVAQNVSIALTTYQVGKLFLLGMKENGELSIFERTFNRCMGLCPSDNGFYMSSLPQVWHFKNMLARGQRQEGYDRLYVPQVAHTTGDLDIHDMSVDADGQLVFVNTLFNCLATLSESHSFKPLWRPLFITELAAEDRCHLNGLAMKDGRAAYVTAVSTSNVADGWRTQRADGGVLIDVQRNEIVATGLSMPHSPRWHQGKLWLLNSGTGYLGFVDLVSGRFNPVTFCPGYTRGLYFHGDYALVGLSKPRHNKTFSGLLLDEALKSHQTEAHCGLRVINLRTGELVHWLNIEGLVDELYDVITLPGVHKPMALGFKNDEIQRMISIEA